MQRDAKSLIKNPSVWATQIPLPFYLCAGLGGLPSLDAAVLPGFVAKFIFEVSRSLGNGAVISVCIVSDTTGARQR